VWEVSSSGVLKVINRNYQGFYTLNFGAGKALESWQLDGDYLVASIRLPSNARSLVLVDMRDNESFTLVANGGTSDLEPHISGTTISYRSGGDIVLAHLIQPTLSSRVAFDGTLTQAGHAIANGSIIVQTRGADGLWSTTLVGPTDTNGTYHFQLTAQSKCAYRVLYHGEADPVPAKSHLSVLGPEVIIWPQAALSAPALLKPSPVHGKTVNLWGSIMPEQPAGTKVTIELWRLIGKKYVRQKKVTAALTSAPGASRYSTNVKFAKAGTWRVRALMPKTALNAATTSAYGTIKVK
jgi:hypothetical protein